LERDAITHERGCFSFNHNKENKVNSSALTASRSHLKLTVKRSHQRMICAAALAAACLLGTASVRAQSAPAAGSASGGKVGVINARQAIVSTAEGKQASAELQSQFAPRTSDLENIGKQISDLRQRLDAGQKTLSDEEKVRLQKQIDLLTRQGQRKQDEYQEDVNAAQADVIDRIGRKMIDVLERYGRENGYVTILDTSAQQSPVLYFSNQIDVTQDIVRLYDQAYPVKGGTVTPTSKPAAKPAAQTPKPAPATPPATKP
jgi:outer membrane protein